MFGHVELFYMSCCLGVLLLMGKINCNYSKKLKNKNLNSRVNNNIKLGYIWSNFSASVIKLIQNMLDRNISRRTTADKALKYSWI